MWPIFLASSLQPVTPEAASGAMDATQVVPPQFHTASAAMNFTRVACAVSRVAVTVVSAKTEPAREIAARAVAMASFMVDTFLYQRIFGCGPGRAPELSMESVLSDGPEGRPRFDPVPELDTD